MARKPNIDYNKLYIQFLDSDHNEVSPFLREKGIIKEGQDLSRLATNVKKRLKGWAEQKQHDIQLALMQARTEYNQEKVEQLKQILDSANQAEIIAVNRIAIAIAKGWPVYKNKYIKANDQGQGGKQTTFKVLDLDSSAKPQIVGYKPLSYSELCSALDKMRLIQGKAGNITAELPVENNQDPLRGRVTQLMNKENLLSNKKSGSGSKKVIEATGKPDKKSNKKTTGKK